MKPYFRKITSCGGPVGNGVEVSRLGQGAQFRDDCSDPGEK